MDGSGHDGEDIHISHIASADDDSNSDDEDAVSQRPLSASFVARNKLSYLLENSAFFSGACSYRSQRVVATAVQGEGARQLPMVSGVTNATASVAASRGFREVLELPITSTAACTTVLILVWGTVMGRRMARRRAQHTDEEFVGAPQAAAAAAAAAVAPGGDETKTPLDAVFAETGMRAMLVLCTLVYWGALLLLPLLYGVSCEHGVPWECHLIFGVVLLFCTAVDVVVACSMTRRVWYWRPITIVRRRCATGIGNNSAYFLGISVLTQLDTYTDLCFILVAHSCGSWWWQPSVCVFVVGIGASQLIPNLFALNNVRTARIDSAHDDFGTLAPGTAMRLLDHRLSSAVIQQLEPDRSMRWVFSSPGLVRFVLEDLPQCFIQYRYLQESRRATSGALTGADQSTVLLALAVSIVCSVFGAISSVWRILKTLHDRGDNSVARLFSACHCGGDVAAAAGDAPKRRRRGVRPETWCGVRPCCCRAELSCCCGACSDDTDGVGGGGEPGTSASDVLTADPNGGVAAAPGKKVIV